MVLNLLILFAGFFILIYGADQLVKGASSFAKQAGVSSLVIGLTIVAFGSSAPELIVNVFAAINGSSEIALANVMGSNIANIFLVLGIASLVRPLVVGRLPVWREIPFAILGTGMVLALAMDNMLGNGVNVVSRGEGIALLGFFSIFLYFTGMSVLRSRAKNGGEKITEYKPLKSWFMIAIGLIGLIVGGKLIVDGAVSIATALHVSEALIGLTVIAIGTSLPELVTSVVAAYKGHTDMAIGNVVGSVIFNALWIVGLSATISPLSVHPGGEIEIWIAFIAAFLLFPFMVNGKRVGELVRWEGAMFLCFYVVFIVFSIWRG